MREAMLHTATRCIVLALDGNVEIFADTLNDRIVCTIRINHEPQLADAESYCRVQTGKLRVCPHHVVRRYALWPHELWDVFVLIDEERPGCSARSGQDRNWPGVDLHPDLRGRRPRTYISSGSWP